MKQILKQVIIFIILLSIHRINLNKNNFLDKRDTSPISSNKMDHHSLDKRMLLTYISCTVTEMFNRSWGVFLPTGFTGAGSSSNCTCKSGLTFNSSDPLRFCMCTDSSKFLDEEGNCLTLSECNSAEKVAYEGYCMSCPTKATRSGNTCSCSNRTDGKRYWRINQCVPCKKTQYTTGNLLYNGSCACYRGQTTAYLAYDNTVDGNVKSFTIYLQSNFNIKLGTCYVEGGNFSGSSTISLSRNSSVVSSNSSYSHSSCSGGGSFLQYTPTASDYYTIQIQCTSTKCKSDLSYSIENIEIKRAYGYYSSTTNSPQYLNYGSYTGRSQDVMLNSLSVGDYIIVESYNFAYSYLPYRGLGDPHIYLYDAGNTEITHNDDGGAGLNFLLNYNVVTSGNYYIKLTTHNGNPVDADYKIIVQKYNALVNDFNSNTFANSFINFYNYRPYSYENNCFKECPNNTIINDAEYICTECSSPSYIIYDRFNCSSSCPTSDKINNIFCYSSCIESLGFQPNPPSIFCTNCFTTSTDNVYSCNTNCPTNQAVTEENYFCRSCGFYIYANKCIYTCPTGLGVNGSDKYCANCPASAQYIYDSKCLSSCPSGLGSLNGAPNCVTCPVVVHNSVCYNSCPANTGNFPDDLYNCITCPNVLYNVVCYDDCPGNTGITTSNTYNCNPCPNFIENDYCVNQCNTNRGIYGSDKNCTNCLASEFVDIDYKCVTTCQNNGYGIIETERYCKLCANTTTHIYIRNNKCLENCPTLMGTDTDNHCDTCPSTKQHLYENVCRVDCPYGLGKDTDINCVTCPSNKPYIYDYTCLANCPSLMGTDTDNYCDSCPSTKQQLYQNVCRIDCPYGMGKDNDINCVICPSNKPYIHDYTCLTDCPYLLATDTDNYCVICPSDKPYIHDNKCLSDCPFLLGTDTDSTYCVTCPETKNQLYENVCRVDCPYNMGKDIDINCVKCPSNKPYISDYTCLESCPDGLGIATSGMTCMICPHDKPYIFENYCAYKCPESLGVVNFDTCQECPETTPLVMDNQCVQNCDSKYGLMENSNMCIVCDRDFPLLFKQNCVTECPENYGLMLADSYYECLKCPNNMSFIYESRCIEQCPEGYGTIEDSIYCNICEDPNIYLHESKCLSTCPEKTYMDDANKKCSSSCRESTKYIVDGKCSSSCPQGYGMFNSGKTNVFCGQCTGDLLLFSDGFCKKSDQCDDTLYYVDLENNKCVDCSTTNNPIYYNKKCVATCPSGFTHVDKTCELTSSIDSSSSNSTDTGNSTDSSSSPPKVVTCTTGQEKVTDAEGNEACFSCKVLKKYVESGVCVEKCSGNANFDSSTNECLVCGTKFTQKTSTGYTCVDKCDAASGYFIDSASTSSCVKCSDNGKYIQDSKCVDKCKNYYTANSSSVCVSCIESDKKYIVDTACVAACPEGYTVKTVSGRENTCSIIEKDPTCTATYCQNNGKCSVESSGKLKCTCTGDFKGSLCDKTSADIQNMSAQVSESLNKLNSLNSTTPMSSSDLEEINSIKELIKGAPEIVSDEMLNDLISITSNQLKLIENLTVDNIGIMDLVDTAFTAYSSSSKSGTSNIDITEVKDSVNKLTSSLTSSITDINEFISNSGSSVLYSGDTFSIQLTDNSNDSLSESRKNKLAIVDYDQCTNILREAGVIGENENLYAQNILFDSSLSSNKNSSDISSSNSMSTTIVNQYGKEVNTTLCKAFTYKMPINNNVIDVESQLDLSEKLGVDVFNSSDTFFTDVCFSYPNNGTDVTVSSRRSKYNVTAGCSTGCTYNGVDEYGYTICDCPSTSGETSSAFEESVFDSLLKSNIVLFKCASNLFSTDVIYNAGFWAVSFISSFCVAVILFHYLTFNNTNSINKIVMNDAISIDPKMVGQVDVPRRVISTNTINTINSFTDKKNKYINITINSNNLNNEGYVDKDNINNKEQISNLYSNIRIIDDDISLKNKTSNDKIVNKYCNIKINDNTTENTADIFNVKNNIIISSSSNSLNKKRDIDNDDLVIIPFKVGKISKDNKEEKNIINNNNNNNISHYDLNNNESNILDNNLIISGSNQDNANRQVKTNSLVKTFLSQSKKSNSKLTTNSNKTFFSNSESNIDNNNLNIIANKDRNIVRKDNTVVEKYESGDKEVFQYSVKTSRDLMELPIDIAIKLDKRSLLQFIWDDMKMSHPYINIFLIKSILNPFIVRFLGIMFGISMECALNAMFFTDDYIDKQADVKTSEGEESTGFFYTLFNEFSRSLWPVVISNIIVFFTGLFLIIPQKYKKELNINLLDEDKIQQVKGVYITYTSIITIIHLICWYFVMAFCSVYINSNVGWVYGALISFTLEVFVMRPGLCVMKGLLRWLVQKYPNK